MANPSLLSFLDPWRVSGIFAPQPEREARISERIARLSAAIGADLPVVRFAARRHSGPGVFALEDMSSHRSRKLLQVMDALAAPSILVMDDIETIRHYPQSMTRNIIIHIAPRAHYKIVAGGALITTTPADLYAEFAVLSKLIVHANHYWCFLANHREVSVFDGRTVEQQQDIDYLACKLRPFVFLDPSLPAVHPAAEQLHAALHAAPFLPRLQDLTALRLA